MNVRLEPEQEKRLKELALRKGKSPDQIVGELIDMAIGDERAAACDLTTAPSGGTGFYNMPVDLDELIETKGVKPVQNIDELASDVWPENEDADEFIRAIRDWRDED